VTLEDYATAYKLTRAQARARLIELALRHLEGRARSGAAYSVAIGPAERSTRARAAVNARWDKVKEARLRADAGVVCLSPAGCPRHGTGTEHLCGPCRDDAGES
jgi:hypothetical protein